MIRLIIEIEQKGDAVGTRFQTDGLQKNITPMEMKVVDALRSLFPLILGEKIRSSEYSKDLPPSGGNKQT